MAERALHCYHTRACGNAGESFAESELWKSEGYIEHDGARCGALQDSSWVRFTHRITCG